MARTARRVTGGVLFLDCEGLSKLVRQDRHVLEIIEVAKHDGFTLGASVLTFVEATHDKVDQNRLNWVRRAITPYVVTEEISRDAERLLLTHRDHHGHKYAIDAVVAATLLRLDGPRVILTSDVEDMERFLEKRAKVIKV